MHMTSSPKGIRLKSPAPSEDAKELHPEHGEKVIQSMVQSLEEVGTVESPSILMGKTMILIMAPGPKRRNRGRSGCKTQSYHCKQLRLMAPSWRAH